MSTDTELPRREPIPLVVPPVTLEGRAVRLEPLRPASTPRAWPRCASPRSSSSPPGAAHPGGRGVRSSPRPSEGGAGHRAALRHLRPGHRRAAGHHALHDDLPNDRTLEIGHTWLARRAWRTRVNTECKYLLLRHAFETLRVMRVQLKTDQRNARSRAAIERIGAKFEGLLRNHMLVRGGVVRDTAYYSIIDTEWPDVKARAARARSPAEPDQGRRGACSASAPSLHVPPRRSLASLAVLGLLAGCGGRTETDPVSLDDALQPHAHVRPRGRGRPGDARTPLAPTASPSPSPSRRTAARSWTMASRPPSTASP